MKLKFIFILSALLNSFIAAPFTSNAEGPKGFEISIHGDINLGNGKPANDIPGYGFLGRYRVRENWLIGLGLNQYEFDFERPYEIIGVKINPSEKAIDSKQVLLS